MKTAVIYNGSLDPAFNLAAEQYLTETFGKTGAGRVVMIWRNEKSVIIGRNQNAFAETDPDFAEKHGIGIYRRLTGGGAVFHDPGNVNYTVIEPDRGTNRLGYGSFCAPVIKALSGLGIEAVLSGRNDLTVGGKKISGSAECVNSGCVLHHGTLLWSADTRLLSGVLRPPKEKLAAKGIASVSSRVANLRDLIVEGQALTKESDGEEFALYLLSALEGDRAWLTEENKKAIREIADRRYALWEWNFGRSPAFSVRRSARFPFGSVSVEYDSDRGRITGIAFHGDFIGMLPVTGLEDLLVGCRLEGEELRSRAKDAGLYIGGMTPDQLAGLITGTARE